MFMGLVLELLPDTRSDEEIIPASLSPLLDKGSDNRIVARTTNNNLFLKKIVFALGSASIFVPWLVMCCYFFYSGNSNNFCHVCICIA